MTELTRDFSADCCSEALGGPCLSLECMRLRLSFYEVWHFDFVVGNDHRVVAAAAAFVNQPLTKSDTDIWRFRFAKD